MWKVNLKNSFKLKPSVGVEDSCKQGAKYSVFRYHTLLWIMQSSCKNINEDLKDHHHQMQIHRICIAYFRRCPRCILLPVHSISLPWPSVSLMQPRVTLSRSYLWQSWAVSCRTDLRWPPGLLTSSRLPAAAALVPSYVAKLAFCHNWKCRL